MKKLWTYGILLISLALAPGLKAQQLPTYSQYLLNGFMINPAMAGYDGYTTVNATSRQQWTRLQDAPHTYSASWQTRLHRKGYKIVNNPIRRGNLAIPSTKGRVGLGAFLINDTNGKMRRTGASFTYAYHIIFNNQQLSFGLTAKAFQYRLDFEDLTFTDEGDPVAESGGSKAGYSPDADFGVLFNGVDYFIGLSVSNLLQTSLIVGGDKIEYETRRHYWLIGGYRYRLNHDWEIEPAFLFKTPENWSPQGDLSFRIYFSQLVWGGVSYRTNNSIVGLLGAQVDNVYFGYAFDWSFNELSTFFSGTHEITLAVKLGENARKSKSRVRY